MELPVEKYYSYADLLAMGEDVRAEIIYGDLYMMSAPIRVHQDVLRELLLQIGNFLSDKPCKVYPAPFDVRLFEREDDTSNRVDTVVQPDISVICDKSKLDDKGCKGAPDFIIEILSPSNARQDNFVKLKLYERAKVREYWIADPKNGVVNVYLLEGDKFILSEVYTRKDKAPVTVLPGCEIDLSKVFTEEYI